MTDLKAPEPRQAGPDLSKTGKLPTDGLNLDWAGYLAAGEYRRALAAVRLSPAPLPPALAGSLEAVNDFQEAVRAHHYSQARRSLERLEAELETPETDPEILRTLNRHLDVQQLGVALGSLEGAETARHVEPAALRTALTPALSTPLTRAEALNAIGVLHAVHEEQPEARATFEAALEADAGHYRAISNIGNLELQAGNLKEAEAAQRRAIALNADFAGAHHNLGVALRRQGKLGESVKAIRKGQRLGLRQMRDTDSARLFRSGNPGRAPRKLNPNVLRIVGLLLAVLAFYLFLRP
jgi:tetratricopeptide (TPR) repeat protein